MLPHHMPHSQQHQAHHLQQQQQQQQQQGQQNDHHHLGMPPFSEQRNPWFQQQQMLQMRNQSQNGPDMSNAAVSQQMAELMRNPNMNRMPNQQQNFGFPMGNHGMNPNQPPFLDQNQTNPQNRMSPLGFPNMGGPGGLQGQNPTNFNPPMNRNTMMLQALQRDQNTNRQLELMSLAQNQQNQNAPFNLANRLGAAGMAPHQGGAFGGGGPPGMNQPGGPSQGDLIPNEAMRRPSPHPHPPNQPTQQQPAGGVQPGPQFGNPQQPQMPGVMNNGGRLVLLSELQDRQNAMRTALSQLEFQIRSLTAARSQMPDQIFATKMRTFTTELTQKRDGLQRVTTLINQMTSQGRTHMTLPVAQPPGGPAVSGGQPWVQPGMSNNSLQPPSFAPGMQGGPNAQSPQGQPNGQPSPSPGHISAVTGGAAVRPGSIPPHNPNNGPFPHPNQHNLSNLPFSNNGAPGNPQVPQSVGVMGTNPAAPNPAPNMLNPASFPMPQHYSPLAKDRFHATYKNFCTQKRLVHDQSLLSTETLNIDLHTLHSEVMKEGGGASVQQKDLWAVIAGRMGSVQFPGTATEPPKSGPAAADRVAHVYKLYLAEFDRIYMNSVQNEYRRKLFFQQLSANQLKGLNPQQIQTLVQVSDMPVTELRGKLPDEMLRILETTRPMLRVMKQDQGLLRQIANPGGMPIGSDGGTSSQPPFNSAMAPRMMGAPAPNGMGLPQNNPASTQSAKLHAALQEIQVMKQEYLPKVASLLPVDVSNDQRLEYNNLLEQAHRTSQEVERKLPFFHVALSSKQPDSSASTRKLVTHIINIQQQRQMIGFSTPRFILSLQDLRAAQSVLNTALEYVATHWKAVAGGGVVMPSAGAGPGPGMQMPARPPTQPPINPPGPVTHASPPQVPPSHSSPQATGNPITRPPVNLQPPPPGPKRKGTTPLLGAASPPNGMAINTPTPPANPSTPAANAPTPTHMSSPQTPKSPKGKAQMKPRVPAKPRRPSTTVPKSNVTPTATPVTEPAQIPTPTGANSLKRPREDDEAPPMTNGGSGAPSNVSNAPAGPSSQANGPSNEPSPPKKFKSEWDGPPSEELKKKEEAVENIKTEEDASRFLEQMTQLIQMSNNEDGSGQALSQDISETLDMILKGCSAAPDGDNGTGISSMLGADLTGTGAGVSSPVKDEYEFAELFDFSSYAAHEEDDAGSKANTPDLISSSSTNPSPESGPETDPPHPPSVLSESKLEELSDPLRLDGLKEVDGGESTFYQSNEWKWDAPMTMLDQPWAIFNS